ncbi:hypothetical protein [Palleronia abyssalis]|uniref:Uncharacterized protein n=1 Tax=Palleronia abyssalis TaxID=1501240 RepID=A0A2R8BW05_9RHOB|nr:hypothetical protein [Palleronia abyssalis]SPJ24313.1 hypothetical protein PAA8504_02141 [Palleronia abyssalis]
MMSLSKMFLWPGTKFCEYFSLDPQSEAGLMLRWVVNAMFYTAIGLIVVWTIAA